MLEIDAPQRDEVDPPPNFGNTSPNNPPCWRWTTANMRFTVRSAPSPPPTPTAKSDIDELVQELLHQLPPNMAGFAENRMDTGQGFAAVQWLLEPEMAGKRVPTFVGPLARALETRRLEFFSSTIVLDYVGRKFSSGLPGIFRGASWRMPDMHNKDTKRFVLGLPYGAAPDNIVGAVRMRLSVPFELMQVGVSLYLVERCWQYTYYMPFEAHVFEFLGKVITYY